MHGADSGCSVMHPLILEGKTGVQCDLDQNGCRMHPQHNMNNFSANTRVVKCIFYQRHIPHTCRCIPFQVRHDALNTVRLPQAGTSKYPGLTFPVPNFMRTSALSPSESVSSSARRSLQNLSLLASQHLTFWAPERQALDPPDNYSRVRSRPAVF